jgi:hypothetical protein
VCVKVEGERYVGISGATKAKSTEKDSVLSTISFRVELIDKFA